MQSDRLLSISGGVSFFVPLAIFPAITALVSAYGLMFSPSTITNNLSILNELMDRWAQRGSSFQALQLMGADASVPQAIRALVQK
jgi:membrane protein